MQMAFGLRRRIARWVWRFLSVPLYTKILSVVVAGALLFGAITLYEVWTSMHRIHRDVTLERADALADTLQRRIEEALEAGDLDRVRRQVQLVSEVLPDCRYVRVDDASGEPLFEATSSAVSSTPVRDSVEVVRPLSVAPGKTLRIGIANELLSRELSSIIWPLLMTLVLCLLVSEILAVVLARLLVGPIRQLVDATNRVRSGDFEARARVGAGDEIGQLATAFNQMAESLQEYRRQVQEKEAARQSLLAKIVQAQEDERKTVSRELHDQLGQTLSKVLLSLQSVHRDCGCFNTRCGAIEGDIRDAIDEVRRLAWAMRPSILDDFGIEAALGRYIQELAPRVEFPVDYQCFSPPDMPRLPSQIEVTLYRVTQEAMTNIMRHAEPRHASVVLLRRSAEITLVIEDDGRGFDPQVIEDASDGNGKRRRNGHGPETLGLLGMRERVTLVGGKLTIESRPGSGTAIRVRIPLNEGVPCPSAS